MTCRGWMVCEGIEEHYQRIALKELGGEGAQGQDECSRGDKDVNNMRL